MIGVQNQGNIQRVLCRRRRLFTIQHPQKIAGVAQRGVGRNTLFPLTHTIENRDDHGNLSGQAKGFAYIRFGRHAFLIRIGTC